MKSCRVFVRCAIVLACILALIISCITVFAHSGDTDSNGGHTDYSTGEYHYHHGYSTHQHYDMDGDGIIDCPYEFEDNTEYDYYFPSDPVEKVITEEVAVEKIVEVEKEVVKKVTPTWIKWIVGVLFFIIIILILVIRSKINMICDLNSTIAAERKSAKKEKSDLESALKDVKTCADNTIASLEREVHKSSREVFYAYYKDYDARSIVFPDEVYFLDNFIPVIGKVTEQCPFGDYTVYISSHGNRYHNKMVCGSAQTLPMHKYEVIDHYAPCQKCVPYLSTLTEIPKWYKDVKNIKSKKKEDV